jgi:hypothetical protein
LLLRVAGSASEEERASIEIMFGLSRGMVRFVPPPPPPFGFRPWRLTQFARQVDLIARVAALVARKHRTGYVVFEDEDVDSASPAGETTPYPGLSAEQEVERSKLEVEARNTILELQIWHTSEKFSPIHPRVQFGNSAHRLAMSLFILTNVRPSSGMSSMHGRLTNDPLVHRSSESTAPTRASPMEREPSSRSSRRPHRHSQLSPG